MSLALALIVLFTLIFLANIAEARDNDSLRRALQWLYLLVNVPVFLLGLSFVVFSGEQLTAAEIGSGFTDFRPAGLALLGTAIWGLVATLSEVRRWISRWIPLDPDSAVHTLALILAGYLVGNSIVNLTQGGLEGLIESTAPTSIFQVIATQLLFIAVAMAGAGALVRRDGWKLLERLGLRIPAAMQLIRGLRWVALLVVLQWAVGLLLFLMNQEQAQVLENLNSLLLGDIDTAWEWLILALATGFGEEILFRGALQPVFGLWATSAIFAFAHIQYGFTPATILVFVIGLVLGYIRQRTSTSVAIFVHFGYNFVLGVFALLAPYIESLAT
jgi:membrane protease YdiL (CAAX protease family)